MEGHPTACRFGDFELRPEQRVLVQGSRPLKLGGRAFDLLVVLVERRDRVVSKSELLDLVWPRLVVEENNLQVQVLALRKLLGPGAITTVPGRGYRFTAALHDETPPDARAGASESRPERPKDMLGRDDDLRELEAAVHGHRIVTVLGAGGVGKTTLARHAAQGLADRFADGMVWMDLATVTQDGQVLDTACAAVQVAPRGPAQQLQSLVAALQDAHQLLVFDNAEHVAEAVATLCVALHGQTPRTHVLVTSQTPLRVAAEQLFRLEPLALAPPEATMAEAQASPAVQLFVRCARANDRHFVLDPLNLGAVVRLTRRLDGLPLAIEMAASRVPALSPAQLDEALDERFRWLKGSTRTPLPRQHSLQATMQWTHDLLTPSEQKLFRRLSIFGGGFALPQAQQICRDAPGEPAGEEGLDEWRVLDALAVLVDRSLVTPPQGDPPRYRLLDTPQAFASRCSHAAGEAPQLQERHAREYGALYRQAYDDYLDAGLTPAAWQARYGADADNGRIALEWAAKQEPRLALAMCPGLSQALARARAIPQRMAVWTLTEAISDERLAPATRARWALGWAQFFYRYKPGPAEQKARQAAALFRSEGHVKGEYRSWAAIAIQLREDGDAQRIEALEQLRRLEQPAWPAALRALRRHAEAIDAAQAGRYDDALAISEGLAGHDPGDEAPGFAHVGALMYLEMMAGRPRDAVERGLRVRQQSRKSLREWTLGGMDMLIVLAWALQGDAAGARTLAPGMWRAARRLDFEAPVLPILALIAALEARPCAAALLLGRAAAAGERTGFTPMPLGIQAGRRAERLARQALGVASFESLATQGRTLDADDAGRIAFDTADVAAPGAR